MGSGSAQRDVGIRQTRRTVHRMRTTHDGDGVLHMLQGCLQYVEELTSWMRWILMILVDGYQDGMLSRTTMTSGGGGCKDLQFRLSVTATGWRACVVRGLNELHSGIRCELRFTCEWSYAHNRRGRVVYRRGEPVAQPMGRPTNEGKPT